MEPFLLTVDPGMRDEENLYSHEGEEFLMILDGEAELLLEEERIVLAEGDCVYFESSLKHRLLSHGGGAPRSWRCCRRAPDDPPAAPPGAAACEEDFHASIHPKKLAAAVAACSSTPPKPRPFRPPRARFRTGGAGRVRLPVFAAPLGLAGRQEAMHDRRGLAATPRQVLVALILLALV